MSWSSADPSSPHGGVVRQEAATTSARTSRSCRLRGGPRRGKRRPQVRILALVCSILASAALSASAATPVRHQPPVLAAAAAAAAMAVGGAQVVAGAASSSSGNGRAMAHLARAGGGGSSGDGAAYRHGATRFGAGHVVGAANTDGSRRAGATSGSWMALFLPRASARRGEDGPPWPCHAQSLPPLWKPRQVYSHVAQCGLLSLCPRCLRLDKAACRAAASAGLQSTQRALTLAAVALGWVAMQTWSLLRPFARFWYSALWERLGTTLLVSSVGIVVSCIALHIFIASGSANQISSLAAFQEDMTVGTSLYEAEFELESDEYEFEDDSEAEQPSDPSVSKPLRRAFMLGHRRKGSDGLPRRPTSMVRITSSDPSSTLSTTPIQLELDGFAGKPVPGAAGGSTALASPMRGSGALRKRKESGRLASTFAHAHTSTARESTHAGTHHAPSPSRLGRNAKRSTGTGGRLHKRASSEEARVLERTSASSSPRLAATSVAGVAATPATKAALADAEPNPGDTERPGSPESPSDTERPASALGLLSPLEIDNAPTQLAGATPLPSATPPPPPIPSGPTPILKREPERFACIPFPLPTAPYPASSGTFSSLSLDMQSADQHTGGQEPSGGMAGDDDCANQDAGDIDGKALPALPLHAEAGLPGVSLTAPITRSGSLPPGAGHAPEMAAALAPLPVPRLGTLSPAQVRAAWPEKRRKSIQLVEPDWTPYADTHDRARERLEIMAQLASHPDPTSLEYVSPATALARRADGRAPWEDAEEVSSMMASTDRVMRASLDGHRSEFWFERYTQSTAAAGRDWDWRKRRARQRSKAAAEAGHWLMNGSTLSLPAGVGGGSESDARAADSARIPRPRRSYRNDSLPLGGGKREDSRPRVASLSSSQEAASYSPSSPLRQERRSSASGSSHSAGVSPVPANSPVSAAAPLPPASASGLGSSTGSLRQRMLGMVSRRGGSDPPDATSEATSDASSNHALSGRLRGAFGSERTRRHSETGRLDALFTGDAAGDLVVPGRLSSIRPRQRLSSLTQRPPREVDISTARLLLAGMNADPQGGGGSPSTASASSSLLLPSEFGQPRAPMQGASAPGTSEGDVRGVSVGIATTQALGGAAPRSSADMYSSTQSTTNGTLQEVDIFGTPVRVPDGTLPKPPARQVKGRNGHFAGGTGSSPLNSRPTSPSSLRRVGSSPVETWSSRSTSATESTSSSPRSLVTNLAALGGDPPSHRVKPRSGSRRSILASAGGSSESPPPSSPRGSPTGATMRSDLATRTRMARGPALEKAAAEASSRRPTPAEQPEPAPAAMAMRARSASLSSQESGRRSGTASPSLEGEAGAKLVGEAKVGGSSRHRRSQSSISSLTSLSAAGLGSPQAPVSVLGEGATRRPHTSGGDAPAVGGQPMVQRSPRRASSQQSMHSLRGYQHHRPPPPVPTLTPAFVPPLPSPPTQQQQQQWQQPTSGLKASPEVGGGALGAGLGEGAAAAAANIATTPGLSGQATSTAPGRNEARPPHQEATTDLSNLGRGPSRSAIHA